jgi:2-oxoglutarate dehydrogenase E1 component
MEQIIKRGGALGVTELVIGMPHRGRLSVLANVMGKPYRAIFNEFQGGSFKPEDVDGSGDVKYHLGASSDREFDGNTVHLSLTANPSPPGGGEPRRAGQGRAKQDQAGDTDRTRSCRCCCMATRPLPARALWPSALACRVCAATGPAARSIFIVNNQIGFTTAPHFSRSSPYPTDIALMVEAPIFHVNGDDPEAVVHAAKVATEFRQKFHKDVVIDMFCYRRFGHNEGDEPMFTNPIMYKKIKTRRPRCSFIPSGWLQGRSDPRGRDRGHEGRLPGASERRVRGRQGAYKPNKADWLDGRWSHLDRKGRNTSAADGDQAETLAEIGAALTRLPDGFNAHKTVSRLLEAKRAMFDTGTGFDWATAEALAFGTLLTEGYPVRLSGQDSTRGTFSQRHSGLVDQRPKNATTAEPHPRGPGAVRGDRLDAVGIRRAGFRIRLFAGRTQRAGDVGGAVRRLCQWRADHVRPVHLSGERKWLRMSGLVMLLPHGFEGQGPEHSSARLERFLQMCGRGQLDRGELHDAGELLPHPAPAVAPRLPQAAGADDAEIAVAAQAGGVGRPSSPKGPRFHRVLWDDAQNPADSTTKLVADDKIRRVVLCSGKVYFDLLEERDSARHRRHLSVAGRAVLSVPGAVADPGAGAVQGGRDGLVPGRAQEPGCLELIEPNLEWVLTRLEGGAWPAALCRPGGGGLARHRASASQHKAQQAALVNEALTIEGRRLMAIEVRVPTLGESVTEATVAHMVQEGRRRGRGRRGAVSSSKPTRCRSRCPPPHRRHTGRNRGGGRRNGVGRRAARHAARRQGRRQRQAQGDRSQRPGQGGARGRRSGWRKRGCDGAHAGRKRDRGNGCVLVQEIGG